MCGGKCLSKCVCGCLSASISVLRVSVCLSVFVYTQTQTSPSVVKYIVCSWRCGSCRTHTKLNKSKHRVSAAAAECSDRSTAGG